jgi:hypothetical protein
MVFCYFSHTCRRFAQFFISPLISADGVEREVQAVDSEHGKNLAVDAWRLHQLTKATANQQHPWARFFTGTPRQAHAGSGISWCLVCSLWPFFPSAPAADGAFIPTVSTRMRGVSKTEKLALTQRQLHRWPHQLLLILAVIHQLAAPGLHAL